MVAAEEVQHRNNTKRMAVVAPPSKGITAPSMFQRRVL